MNWFLCDSHKNNILLTLNLEISPYLNPRTTVRKKTKYIEYTFNFQTHPLWQQCIELPDPLSMRKQIEFRTTIRTNQTAFICFLAGAPWAQEEDAFTGTLDPPSSCFTDDHVAPISVQLPQALRTRSLPASHLLLLLGIHHRLLSTGTRLCGRSKAYSPNNFIVVEPNLGLGSSYPSGDSTATPSPKVRSTVYHHVVDCCGFLKISKQ